MHPASSIVQPAAAPGAARGAVEGQRRPPCYGAPVRRLPMSSEPPTRTQRAATRHPFVRTAQERQLQSQRAPAGSSARPAARRADRAAQTSLCAVRRGQKVSNAGLERLANARLTGRSLGSGRLGAVRRPRAAQAEIWEPSRRSMLWLARVRAVVDAWRRLPYGVNSGSKHTCAECSTKCWERPSTMCMEVRTLTRWGTWSAFDSSPESLYPTKPKSGRADMLPAALP